MLGRFIIGLLKSDSKIIIKYIKSRLIRLGTSKISVLALLDNEKVTRDDAQNSIMTHGMESPTIAYLSASYEFNEGNELERISIIASGMNVNDKLYSMVIKQFCLDPNFSNGRSDHFYHYFDCDGSQVSLSLNPSPYGKSISVFAEKK